MEQFKSGLQPTGCVSRKNSAILAGSADENCLKAVNKKQRAEKLN
jgi:hypothetical protein